MIQDVLHHGWAHTHTHTHTHRWQRGHLKQPFHQWCVCACSPLWCRTSWILVHLVYLIFLVLMCDIQDFPPGVWSLLEEALWLGLPAVEVYSPSAFPSFFPHGNMFYSNHSFQGWGSNYCNLHIVHAWIKTGMNLSKMFSNGCGWNRSQNSCQ